MRRRIQQSNVRETGEGSPTTGGSCDVTTTYNDKYVDNETTQQSNCRQKRGARKMAVTTTTATEALGLGRDDNDKKDLRGNYDVDDYPPHDKS
jgi:hypothetical protein